MTCLCIPQCHTQACVFLFQLLYIRLQTLLVAPAHFLLPREIRFMPLHILAIEATV